MILVEGILIFAERELRELFDVKIFVDADSDIRFIRRLMRDMKDRGRSLDSVVEQYMTTVRPMHMEFVEPSKRYADVIIPEGGHNQVALDMVVSRVQVLLRAPQKHSHLMPSIEHYRLLSHEAAKDTEVRLSFGPVCAELPVRHRCEPRPL